MARKRSTRKVSKKVHFIPDGYHSVTPYLACQDAARAIEFYKQALGAKELMRMPAPGGRVGHAEIRIGDSRIMLADEYPDIDFLEDLSKAQLRKRAEQAAKEAGGAEK